MSVLVIGVAAAMLGVGTFAYFSDIEKSEGNKFIVGTVDIAVDGENPWTHSYEVSVDGDTLLKPCEKGWITFVIKNVGDNPVNVWKHLEVTDCNGGEPRYPTDAPVASSEPEHEEGLVNGDYNERCWLPPYIVYDLYVNEAPIITQEHEIRVDMISCVWIYLGKLEPDGEMIVKQSYHLTIWEGAPVSEITNWAQGDVMEFTIELYADQLTGPGPIPATDTLRLENKDPVTWEIINPNSRYGELTYDIAGTAFNYTFEGYGLGDIEYNLIYYADPWPGNGKTGSAGALIGTGTASVGRLSLSGSPDLGMDIPDLDDKNYPVGGKIWLVPSSDYDSGTNSMTAWNPTEYLFETHLINYDDTDA